MEQRSGTEIGLGVPPVAGARGATAGAENALVHPVELLPLLLALQNLFSRHRWVLPLQPGLDTLILIVEVRHVHDQVLDHEHVRQRSDRRGGGVFFRGDLGEARQAVAAVDVHCAGAADPLAARAAEREARVDLVLDLDERVEDHGPTLL